MAASLHHYIATLGQYEGLRLYVLSKLANDPFPVRVPGIAQAVQVRPRTSDRNMLSDVLLDREYDLPLDAPPRFIVDAGANAGYTSVFFAHRYPDARIVALEPEESNFSALLANVRRLPQVTPLHLGLWPRVAQLRVENPDDVKSGFRMTECAPDHPGAVRATTLPALMEQFGVEQIDVCKIDIEGGECELFSDPGCDAWLSRTRVLILELHDRYRPDASRIVEQALARHPHMRETRGSNLVYRLRSPRV